MNQSSPKFKINTRKIALTMIQHLWRWDGMEEMFSFKWATFRKIVIEIITQKYIAGVWYFLFFSSKWQILWNSTGSNTFVCIMKSHLNSKSQILKILFTQAFSTRTMHHLLFFLKYNVTEQSRRHTPTALICIPWRGRTSFE